MRPHLEYAAPLWSPYTQKDINSIKNVQKFATKLITHHWDQSYTELLELTNIPTLSLRRTHFKLHQVYRIVRGLYHFPEIFQQSPAYSNRFARSNLLHQLFAHTNAYFLWQLFQVLWLRGMDLLNSKYLQVVFQPLRDFYNNNFLFFCEFIILNWVCT